jgi:hypothetical protein
MNRTAGQYARHLCAARVALDWRALQARLCAVWRLAVFFRAIWQKARLYATVGVQPVPRWLWHSIV